jgi:tetratricopeptide (TPR) repeat protein
MGTTLINAATAYKAFGAPAQALPLYERARTLYESLLSPDDSRLGGLYNNMALALTELGEYRRAEALYRRALEVMEKAPRGALETAITWCNLADLSCAELGQEAGEARISACLDKAQTLLDDDTLPRNAYYAFVCEKCAPTFAYYGFFRAAQALSRRAEEITRQLQRAD